MQSAGAVYFVTVVRVGFGAILLWAAPNSRAPLTLRVLGIFIIIAGVVTPFFGVERPRGMLEWWAAQGSLLARAWPIVAIGFGLFIAYATTPRSSGT